MPFFGSIRYGFQFVHVPCASVPLRVRVTNLFVYRPTQDFEYGFLFNFKDNDIGSIMFIVAGINVY